MPGREQSQSQPTDPVDLGRGWRAGGSALSPGRLHQSVTNQAH